MTHPMEPTTRQVVKIYAGRTMQEALKKAYTDGADAELEACCRWLEKSAIL